MTHSASPVAPLTIVRYIRTRAEQSRANADFGSAFFDRNLKIVAHTHGQNWERTAETLGQSVSQFAKLAEIRTRTFRIVEKRRNGHQSGQFQMHEGSDARGQSRQIRFCDSAFCLLATHVYLDQYRKTLSFRFRRCMQFFRERKIVHCIYAPEEVRRAAGFIALQVADQVPGRVQVRDFPLLRFPLLHAILTEVPNSRLVGRTNRFDWMGLRNRNQDNFVGAAPRSLCGARNALANLRQIRADCLALVLHRRDSSMCGQDGIGRKVGGCAIEQARRVSYVLDRYARLERNSMSTRGKFIALEGIDGSGKGTQLEMLARAFESRGIAFNRASFPHYVGFFGKLVANFLNGEFGPLETVDPHFSAMLYAGDRWEARPMLEADLDSGRAVLADRYVASNLAHQGARVAREKRLEFLAWLKELEYRVYALPTEDLVLYLRVPAQEAQRLVGEKAKRDYTKLQHDLLESNLHHLQRASEVYDELARQPNWVMIECYDAAARALRAAEEIHQEILTAIEARLFPTLQARR